MKLSPVGTAYKKLCYKSTKSNNFNISSLRDSQPTLIILFTDISSLGDFRPGLRLVTDISSLRDFRPGLRLVTNISSLRDCGKQKNSKPPSQRYNRLPCYLPVLGEFSGSWSYRFAGAN